MNNLMKDDQPIEEYPPVQEVKSLWGVWNNTDLTEGRGAQYIQYVCELKATALRYAKQAGIQGCDADVVPIEAYLIKNNWYYRGRPISPSKEDKAQEELFLAQQALKEKQEKVLQKAIELGLSEQDIEILRQTK